MLIVMIYKNYLSIRAIPYFVIFNDPEFYKRDPKFAINEEYLSKTYDKSEIEYKYIQK